MIVDLDKLFVQEGRSLPTELRPELRDSIVAKGLLSPLIVNSDYEIIDGLERLAIAKALGWTEIDVQVAEGYNRACDMIEKTRLTEPSTMRPINSARIWAFWQAMEPLMRLRLRERYDAMWGRKRGEKYGEKLSQRGSAREMLAKALGLPSETYVQLFARIHKIASDPDDPQQKLAKQLWRKLLKEEITPYSAYGQIRRDLDKRKLVTNVIAQRTVLKGMVPVADALTVSLSALGDIADGITVSEADEWLTTIRKLRAVLATTQNRLTHHKTSKESVK